MKIEISALAVAALLTGLFYTSRDAYAQWNEAGTATEIEFSNSAPLQPSFATPGLGRHVDFPTQLASIPTALAPDNAASRSSFGPASGQNGIDYSQHLFEHLFLSGIADLVRGDPADAIDVFEATAGIAPEMPQMNYLLALARVLSDFEHRDQAVPLVEQAMAKNPGHALYGIVNVLADPRLSVLKSDGALYFTASGAKLLHAAAARLPSQVDAYNGQYLSILLTSLEKTDDAALPECVKGFSAMLGPGRSIAFPNIATTQALGRLLVLSIPPDQLARFDSHFIAGDERESASPVEVDIRGPELADRRSILLP